MKTFKFLIVFTIVIVTNDLYAGWSNHAHTNYLKEAVSVLNCFDFEMCLTYKNELSKGIAEGEIQYKYRAKGYAPEWLGELSEEEVSFLQGNTIDMENIDRATEFFYNKFQSLQNDIITIDRPYSEVMFELGYLLHSINNILLPLYEKGHFPEEQLASNTDSLELSMQDVEQISDLKDWIKTMIERKIAMRNNWTDFANNNDLEGFIKYADEANKKNIYTISSIFHFVLSDCYGPENKAVRAKLEPIHEKHYKKVNGRKSWD